MSLPQLIMRREDLLGLPAVVAPSGIIIRRAVIDDADGIAACLCAAFSDPTWDRTRVCTTLLTAPDVPATIVAMVGTAVAATASLRRDPAHADDIGILHWVARHPHHAATGLGLQVSLAVLHVAAEMGLVSASLLTDDARLPAIRIYWRLGFRPFLSHRSHPARWQAVHAALA